MIMLRRLAPIQLTASSACLASRPFSPAAKLPPPPVQKRALPNVTHVVLVGSGKGGVGKSTCAVNLAVSLAASKGLRVGLLDADTAGPSIPRMMRLEGLRPEVMPADGGRIVPLENHGVKCMSMGSLVDTGKALAWRGPMVGKALEQLLFGVAWGGLDVLLVDLPPGTGDTHISLAQRLHIAGAVMVTTPQEVALSDVRRSLNMLQKVHIPVLGILENMSYHKCACCGRRSEVFGAGGGALLAAAEGVPLLACLPLDEQAMHGGEEGAPVVLTHPYSAIGAAFRDAAAGVCKQLELETGR